MLIHNLGNKYMLKEKKNTQIKETSIYPLKSLHFGYIFRVGQFSKYCLDKINLVSVHTDRFPGLTLQSPV